MMKLLISKDISLTSSHAWSLTNFRNFILKKFLRTCSGKRNTPVLDAGKEHYKKYDEVKEAQVTSDKHRPSSLIVRSLNKKIKDGQTNIQSFTQQQTIENLGAGSSKPALSTQTARATVTCVECRKHRVIYSSKKLDFRHNVILARNITSFEYSCEAHLFPPSEERKLAVSMKLRPNLSCAVHVEIPYYGADLGRKDLFPLCKP